MACVKTGVLKRQALGAITEKETEDQDKRKGKKKKKRPKGGGLGVETHLQTIEKSLRARRETNSKRGANQKMGKS